MGVASARRRRGGSYGHWTDPDDPEKILIPNWFELVWNRDHFYEPWPEGFDDTVIVHGHTPISYLKEDGIIKFQKGVGDILAYDDGHKIDIDTGAVRTGVAVLLDLDTFELHRIYGHEWDHMFD